MKSESIYGVEVAISETTEPNKVYFLPKEVFQIIGEFIRSGKINGKGEFSSKFAEMAFRFSVMQYADQIAVLNLGDESPAEAGPKEPEAVRVWKEEISNLQHVLDNSHGAVPFIPRKAGLNSVREYQKSELQKCRENFNYFCEKHLKINLHPHIQSLFNYEKNKPEKHRTGFRQTVIKRNRRFR